MVVPLDGTVEARSVGLEEVVSLRERYRDGAGYQIVRDSILPRGLADPYILIAADQETAIERPDLAFRPRAEGNRGPEGPAARCNPTNQASQRTLERGGMKSCGEILVGALGSALKTGER